MTDFFQQAAQHLRDTLQNTDGVAVGSAHAHDAVAGALGYRSKIALLKSDKIAGDDPCLARHLHLDAKQAAEVIGRMKASPLQSLPIDRVLSVIKDGLTPPCVCCGDKTASSVIVGVCDHEQDSDEPEWVCPACASDEDEFGTCTYCGDNVPYRLEDLNRNGECKEHAGESDLDPEERHDWDSWVEYQTKD